MVKKVDETLIDDDEVVVRIESETIGDMYYEEVEITKSDLETLRRHRVKSDVSSGY